MAPSAPLIPYLRQSRSRERTISIEEQRRDITRWAEREGVALAPEVIEQNVSGSRPWRERGIGEAIAACERGEASGVVVAWQDRLSREHGLATAEVWDALGSAGARLVCAAEGLDTAAGDQELQFSIKAAIARDQWKRHRGNWERARRSAVERGVHVGPVPAGYERPEPGAPLRLSEHAPAVRAAFELRAKGGSWTEVARLLTDRGVPNRKGGPWSLKAASKLTENEAYLGVARSGQFRLEGAHEPIVSRATFERVRGRRGERAVTRGTSEPGLLSGVARCAGCGHRMVQDWTTRGGKRTPFYRCRNGGACNERAVITHAKVEPYVWELAAAEVARREDERALAGNGDAPDPTQNLEDALARAEAEIEAYLLHVRPTTPGFAPGLAKLEAEVEAARQALAASGEPMRFTAQMWEEAQTVAARRAAVLSVVDAVTVKRGAGAVGDRVAVAWRGA